MSTKQNVYLIGPMGAGKSSLGLQLAKITHRTYYDSDREIETRSGVDIDWIFEMEGESGLRKREIEVITHLSTEPNIILSTGGGSITLPEVRNALVATGIIIYLQVPFDEQLIRTKRRPEGRPLLNGPNVEQKLKQLNAEREPLYREIADLSYLAANISPAILAKKIWREIKELDQH